MPHAPGPHVLVKSGFINLEGVSAHGTGIGGMWRLGGLDATAFGSGSGNGVCGSPDDCSILSNPKPSHLDSWPKSADSRWMQICLPKSRNELALLSWNTNGRLELRGCRESLIRCWARKGFVDIALIQETLKKCGSPLFDLFGPDWWNVSSLTVVVHRRGSGGCTIFGQPSFISNKSL